MSDLKHLRRGSPKVKQGRKKKDSPKPVATSARGGLGNFIFGMAAGILLLVLIALLMPGFQKDFGHDDGGDHQHQHEQVEPAKGGMLVFVSDKQLPTADQDLLMRKMPSLVKAKGMEFLWLDDTDPAIEKLKAVAESKGISPPLVGYVKDKEVTRVAKWPDDESAVQSFLK